MPGQGGGGANRPLLPSAASAKRVVGFHLERIAERSGDRPRQTIARSGAQSHAYPSCQRHRRGRGNLAGAALDPPPARSLSRPPRRAASFPPRVSDQRTRMRNGRGPNVACSSDGFNPGNIPDCRASTQISSGATSLGSAISAPRNSRLRPSRSLNLSCVK